MLLCILNIQDGWTALFYASEQGSISIVQLLIDSGVDLKLKDKVDLLYGFVLIWEHTNFNLM